MALFFHSHSCNSICKRLNLSPFVLSVSEKAEIINSQQGSNSSSVSNQVVNRKQTMLRGNEVPISPCFDFPDDIQAYFHLKRRISRSVSITESLEENPDNNNETEHVPIQQGQQSPRVRFDSPPSSSEHNSEKNKVSRFRKTGHRARHQTEIFEDYPCSPTDHLMAFRENIRKKSRTANLEEEMKRNIGFDESILGMVSFKNTLGQRLILAHNLWTPPTKSHTQVITPIFLFARST